MPWSKRQCWNELCGFKETFKHTNYIDMFRFHSSKLNNVCLFARKKDVTKEFPQGTRTDTWTISSFGMWVDAGESDNSLIVFYSNSQFFLLPKEAVMLIFKSRQFHSIMNVSSLRDRLKTPGQRYTCLLPCIQNWGNSRFVPLISAQRHDTIL